MSLLSPGRHRVLFIIILILALIFFCALVPVRHKRARDPSDASETALLYYRGLGLCERNGLIGEKRIRLVTSTYPSGRVRTEYRYSEKGLINMGVQYYADGKIESISPLLQASDGSITDDGILKRYYTNGKVEMEEGRRAGGDGLVQHGIKRTYSEGGTIIEEQFYVNGKKVTARDWKHWLETHPSDIRYG